MRHLTLTAIRATAFVLTVLLWRWLLYHDLAPWLSLLCIVAAPLAVFPTVWLGRRLLTYTTHRLL
jgi:hypothetical protein